ncbi:MAG: HlyC/CorC family transporter [Halieaceae bacterium]|nr:HlyC/CorC family transporter [Halieaceae bacterium]
MNEAPLGLLFSILGVLILLSAFFSSSETGMMALDRYRLKHLKEQNHRGARRASRLLKRPDRLIGLILIGNNLVNVLAAAIVTIIAIRLLGNAGIAIGSLLLTLVLLVFAEITPKTIAALHPERVAFPASAILAPLLKLLYPVVWLVNVITNGLLRLLGYDPRGVSPSGLTTEELRTIVNDTGHMIPDTHQGMLLNILELEKVTVDDIMVPRGEVFGLDLDDPDDVLLEQIQATEYTRLPVFEDDVNNISGILHMRRTSRFIDETGLHREQMLKEIEQPYFVPEGTPLHTQLLNFQRKKLRIGVVVDEYGEVMGLVTLEDILEEIVGEFTSNLAEAIADIYPQQDGTFIINGSANVREINKSLDWELPTDGPKTLNGLLLENLESFPDASAGVRIGDYCMDILELQDNVITSVRAQVREAPPEP